MKTPQLSDAEWKIMNAVWRLRRGAGEAVTARAVVDALDASTGWAYTTVKTMMERLVEKGTLEADRSQKTTHYQSCLSRNAARGDAARNLLKRAFGGAAAPLVHYLVQSEKLSSEDRATLRRMLEEQEATGAGAEADDEGEKAGTAS